MDKLTLQLLPNSVIRSQELYDCLFQHIDSTLHNSSLEWNHYKDYSEISVGRPNPRSNKSAKSKQEWVDKVTGLLADFLLDRTEEDLMRDMIRRRRSCSREEAKEIFSYCRQIMEEEEALPDARDDHGRIRRKKLLSQDISACLAEQAVMNMDGFLRFRLSKYSAELKDIIEYATDEYLMDQQYKEFISLLKYFVYIQDSKIPEAHIMHKGGHEFMLLNNQMLPIETDQADSTFKVEFLDKDYSFEDLIVSTLITLAPEKIYIHTREPELPVIKTISQIFEGRSEICEYCRECHSLLDENGPKDKLSP